jgi:hypothetical protein
MRGVRLASLLVAGSLLALSLAPPAGAKPRYLRFQVSVQGQQTTTWSITEPGYDGCGPTTRGGSQTISFETPEPDRLSLRRYRRTDPRTGRKRDFTYFGTDSVRTNWTFTRSFQQSAPPGCPPEAEPVAVQANDCGTRGPFEVPISVGWRGTAKPGNLRGGTVELRGVLNPEVPGQRSPSYQNCEYEATHTADLLDSRGRLSQRKLTSQRGTMRVKLSEREKVPASEGSSQTTTLEATVTLRRLR